jgi:aspartate/methionine/tyrosine aminotransferase
MANFKPSLATTRVERGSQRPTYRPGPGIISLMLGEPDFDTPAAITDAAVEALRSGYTHYIDFSGDPELRETLAAGVSSIAGERYGPDQIFVTHGGTAAITSTIPGTASSSRIRTIRSTRMLPIWQVPCRSSFRRAKITISISRRSIAHSSERACS